ncbi:hypothetical protein [Blastococcus haudaquaticus]|uniref:Uncharacterized protein n=1 Tax=Blastococcus haudaquaticus TaxID=1938745 RepID=A0A286H2F0_9ACTN|nr:hypothetical protein [Blastococcus haudaquaticus]SOE01509.1 hypothetical protein SAMN06272739_3210 [Blastococcus haudaquaticus]
MAPPPSDQPSGDQLPDDPPPGPESAALVAAGEPGPHNAVTVAAVFWTAVTEPDGPDLEILGLVVTPESWQWWGDFARAALLLPGCGMASEAQPSADDPDVVYLSFLPEAGEGDAVIATLVWRPGLGGWRVHALGERVRPDHVPHDR